MKKGVLINNIELSYAPLSAYTFTKVVRDKLFIENFDDSHLYMIAQRPEITFDNFNFSSITKVEFEIWQKNNPEYIKCILPIFQESIANNMKMGIDIRLHNRKNSVEDRSLPPYNGTQGFTFQEVSTLTGDRKHLIWFTPEKLLLKYWRHSLNLEIKGDFKKFLEYKVHYVGKSTEQNICQRLSNHSTFQEILASQDVITYGNIPSNEIVILLFRIEDNNSIVKWRDDATENEISDYILNYYLPDNKTISLDAEKALINHLHPGYNKILYKSYPNKADLIAMDFHDAIFYCFVDPIKLKYDNGIIKGDSRIEERDYIIVEQLK